VQERLLVAEELVAHWDFMAARPKREVEQANHEIAEIKSLIRKCKRIRRRAMMERMQVRPGPRESDRFLEDLVCWPRPGDGELKLNACAKARARTS